ncbi:MAG TPA: VOC family protein [Thermomicrobiales bacterium]|nr:VOC family protein [Thermomicrobiales bacterium]
MPTDIIRRVMIDHVDLLVADLERSRDFYRAALAPLGMEEHDRGETFSVYGPSGERGSADFAIDLVGPGDAPTSGAHVAFVATSREQVDAFFAAALGAGGREKIAPAEHPEYHEGYYGAFVWDPDGNNIEAVFHGRPEAADSQGGERG